MDHFKQISTFVDVVGRGSLSASARAEGVAPAIIGRRLNALEERLGVKLLRRTTRNITLTNEGEAFLDNCQRILADLQNAELSVSERATRASGHLMVSAPAGFGRRHVAPLVPAFLAAHPEVTLTLNLDDRVVNLVGEGVDVGIRIAAHADSSLVGVKLAGNRRVVVAAPSYLSARGVPMRLEDLGQHNCLTMGADGSQRGWSFRHHGRPIVMKVNGTMSCNDGSVLHEWAIAGKGLAWRSLWEVGAELEAGRLVVVLDEFAAPGDDIYAVYAQRQFLPVRIRTFVDFLRQHYSRADYWSAA
ncbi:LysR family transcriptional regulator [Lacisediminimonas sp.]|uniref:LysR family transcriptional regulator n=1 Tax=Lacisediminimonas sp. TaxID=3060582 RepID=UPI002727960E|nr:LysR family transcriptional regulator [Lacisediminimonas sp.]MDO8299500.1 LysR family transcriptional regulator [Lacisediminimonas sp.]